MLPNQPSSHPFNEAHLPIVNNVLQSAQQAKALIEKAKSIGLDMSAAEQQNNMHEKFMYGIKQQFFPNHP
jgi:predicted lactoylglutathione lyase